MDRRSILLLRRPQNGEVYEINRRIGLEQIAPGSFARVRLSRNEQYAQILAYPLGSNDNTVIRRRQLAIDWCEFDFKDIRASVREAHRNANPLIDPGSQSLIRSIFAADFQTDVFRTRAATATCLADSNFDVARLTDDTELRSFQNFDPPIELVRPTCEQGMYRRIEPKCSG